MIQYSQRLDLMMIRHIYFMSVKVIGRVNLGYNFVGKDLNHVSLNTGFDRLSPVSDLPSLGRVPG